MRGEKEGVFVKIWQCILFPVVLADSVYLVHFDSDRHVDRHQLYEF